MGNHEKYQEESCKAPGAKWGGLSIGLMIVGLVVVGGAYFIAGENLQHYKMNYLTSFMYFLSIALGALFFVLIQHLTRAGWSIVVRRIAEGFMRNLPYMAILFVPIVALWSNDIFAWTDVKHGHGHAAHGHEVVAEGKEAAKSHPVHAGHDHAPKKTVSASVSAAQAEATALQAAKDKDWDGRNEKFLEQNNYSKDSILWATHLDHTLHKKVGYLNTSFFTIRAVVYFLIWSFLSIWLFKKSTSQDTDGNPKTTITMGKASTVGLMLFALTTTFAAFDWIMSLDYGWFSTIFGVIYFAGGVVACMASLILACSVLQGKGYLKGAVNQEHYHDMGKLMFAFTVFWAYVSFSQIILIWYPDLYEETIWFHERLRNGWKPVSIAVFLCHFALPFLLLMSRHIKRNKYTVSFMACWMILAGYLHIYWEVMPTANYPASASFAPQISDIVTFIGMGLFFIGGFLMNMKNVNLVPVKDPRIKESLNFHNY